MKKLLLFALASVLSFGSCATAPAPEKAKYAADWDSLAKHNKIPEWFKDSKLGIYFHWGLYSVPAFEGEWYPYRMYRYANGNNTYKHHKETYGVEFEYHDFAPMFKGEHFDAKEWAQLFKDAGAKFAGPVAVHHDGYALWASKVNPWNAKDIGPEKDILGELFAELEKQDMRTIATFHHARTLQRYTKDTANWQKAFKSHFAYDPNRATSSTDEKLKYMYGNLPEAEFNEYWLEEIREVVEGYDPDIIWFDSWLDEISEEYRKKMVALQYNHNDEGMVIRKQNDIPIECSVLDVEQGGLEELPEEYWMTDITISTGSWCYVNGIEYKPLDVILRNMIDVWSKKGVVLFNISPRSDGVIEDGQREILHGLGEWLSANGEAVYNTRSYDMYGYGNAVTEAGHFGGQSATIQYSADDIRFTTSKDGNTLYAFVLGMPEANGELVLQHIHNGDKAAKSVTVVGSKANVEFSQDGETLTIKTPAAEAMDSLATVFAIKF